MANMEFDGLSQAPGRVQRIVYGGGAVLSLGLILGFCVWGYKLAVRDVAGIPVVRAMEGPMRIAPDDPGGTVSEHQGLAVNAVAAAGVAGDPADRLVLAPRPVDLTLEDEAGSIAAISAPVSGRAEGAPGLMIAATDPEAPADQGDAIAMAVAEATAEDLMMLEGTPLSGDLGAVQSDVLTDMPEMTRVAVVRPQPRPARLGGAPGETPQGVALPTVDIDPATLAPGTRLVQLGAFDSVEAAQADWDKVQARFADVMPGKARVIEAAQSGGRTFFRLRAHGFETETQARQFCEVLLKGQAACIPVAQR